MPPSGLTVKKDNFKQVEKAIKSLVDRRVMVGVPASNGLRQPEPGEKSPPSNFLIAYLMENGCPASHIPPRLFLKPTIEASKGVIKERLKAAAVDALKGRVTAVDQAMHALGQFVSLAVKLKINTGPFQALADATIARRKARGRFGTKPLIDTGQLRNAITYILRRVKGVS